MDSLRSRGAANPLHSEAKVPVPSAVSFRDDAQGPTVAAFAVDLGREFATPPHCHIRGQMVGCTRGVVTITTDIGTWIVPPGHAIWLPPLCPHGGRSFGSGAGWSVYVAPHASAALPHRPRTVAVPPLLREAVLRAATWTSGALDAAQQRVADLIVDEIGTLPAENLDLPSPVDPRLMRISAALLEDPGDRRSFEDWADWAGTTERTLSRRFRQETGLSFSAWRQRARMMRALEMLEGGRSVTATALDLGYESLSGFVTLFRRTFGVTPGAYPLDRSG